MTRLSPSSPNAGDTEARSASSDSAFSREDLAVLGDETAGVFGSEVMGVKGLVSDCRST